MSEWPAGDHLASVSDAIYSSLGRGAARVRVDAFVVRMHEASRAFGALALDGRELGCDVAPDPLVAALFDRAVAEDESGALALYALAMVVGPRLLVSLRDYLVEETDATRRTVLTHASDVVVTQIRAVGAVVEGAEAPDDPAWAEAARALVETLDAAGMAESLGQRY